MQPERFFGILSDPTRLRATLLLAEAGELCVCELTSALEESQPKISRHLALMREAGLVDARRDGTWMHYRLHPELEDWAGSLIDLAADRVGRFDRFRADRDRLEGRVNASGGSRCD